MKTQLHKNITLTYHKNSTAELDSSKKVYKNAFPLQQISSLLNVFSKVIKKRIK